MNPYTLIVGSYNSTCGHCGASCNPHSETHDVQLGYGPDNGKPGCGVRWRYVFSMYGQDMGEFRPDLVDVGNRSVDGPITTITNNQETP